MRIDFHGHPLTLLGQRAVYLPQSRTLVLSDVHLGKAATFQIHGIPVPKGDDLHDLSRMSQLIESTQAKHLIIAGDLLHSPSGISPELIDSLDSWIQKCPASLTLVCGNHDRRAFQRHQMESVSTLEINGLQIIHDPEDAAEGPAICGHLHPVIQMKEGLRRSLRAPCFWLRQQTLILPSFGTFTGGHPIRPTPGQRVFAANNQRVVEIPQECWK